MNSTFSTFLTTLFGVLRSILMAAKVDDGRYVLKFDTGNPLEFDFPVREYKENLVNNFLDKVLICLGEANDVSFYKDEKLLFKSSLKEETITNYNLLISYVISYVVKYQLKYNPKVLIDNKEWNVNKENIPNVKDTNRLTVYLDDFVFVDLKNFEK